MTRRANKQGPRTRQVLAAPPSRWDRTTLRHLWILALAPFALYAYTLRFGFVADDNQEILQDKLLRSFANVGTLFNHSVWFFAGGQGDRYYRPLKTLAYLLEYHLFRLHPAPWHLINILAYVATVLAVYLLVRELASSAATDFPSPGEAGAPGRAGEFAFWTALFFAFHPIHVEAVAWIAAGNDLFCALALLLALWFYHRAPGESRPALAYGASVLLFFAGMLFKESALTFPAVILAYHLLYRGDSLAGTVRAWRRYLGYFVALGAYTGLRIHALRGFAPSSNAYHLTPSEMTLSIPTFAVKYLWKALVPLGQNFRYTYQPVREVGWKPIAAALVVVLMVLAMLPLRRRPASQPGPSQRAQELQPLLSLALAWFWITLAPALALSKISILFTDRYLYTPSFGFCIFLAWGWLWLRNRAGVALPARPGEGPSRRSPLAEARGFASIAVAAVLLFYTVVILRRLPAWHDNFGLYATTEKQSPNDANIVGTVGLLEVQQDRLEEGLALLQRAALLDPHEAAYPSNEASALMSLGRVDDALHEARKAAELQPDFPLYWTNLAIVYEKKGEWNKADETCRRGLAVAPNDHAMLTACGLARWHMGDRNGAIAAYQQAIKADPEALDAYINLANAHAQLHQLDAATAEFQAALQANPNSHDLYIVHFELGVIYETESQWRAAALEYQEALRLNPQFITARANLQPLLPFLTNPNLTRLPFVPAPR
ncbi:MAG TPA: tetratricopeptide repeat protein [Candidatus Acidoferrales bacterium]|nr:tetratricopeptide repeat protein [Candidatus Acidoferrales bacterium]